MLKEILSLAAVIAVVGVLIWGLMQLPLDAAVKHIGRVVLIVLLAIYAIYALAGLAGVVVR